MKLSLLPFSLENKIPFKISYGVRTHTDTLFVEVLADGVKGLGEASHVPYYGITVQESVAIIEENWNEISAYWGKAHDVFWLKINDILGKNHFAKCVLDIAHYDWCAKRAEKPLWDYLGLSVNNLPKSCFTIGMDEPEKMAEAISASKWPSLKIKLGGENDLKTLNFLEKGIQKPFKIDVNAAWSLDTALAYLPELQKMALEFIEQPLAKEQIFETGLLREQSSIPIFADESCFYREDVIKCSKSFDGINIKLSKCGGVFPALEMIKEARELNLKVMMGCMTESSVGISTIAHLSSLLDYVDMDGAELLKNDPAQGVKVVEGVAIFNDEYGHGAELIK